MNSESSFLAEQSLKSESSISLSSDDGKNDLDFGLPLKKTFKKSDLLLVSILIPLGEMKPSVRWRTNIVLAIEGQRR